MYDTFRDRADVLGIAQAQAQARAQAQAQAWAQAPAQAWAQARAQAGPKSDFWKFGNLGTGNLEI